MHLGKARNLTSEISRVRGSTLVGSSLAHEFSTRLDVANTLAYYHTATITAVKGFIVQALGFHKHFLRVTRERGKKAVPFSAVHPHAILSKHSSLLCLK